MPESNRAPVWTCGVHSVRLPAGHLVLYPASSLHTVTPVTRGARVSSFFWIQSMLRDDGSPTPAPPVGELGDSLGARNLRDLPRT